MKDAEAQPQHLRPPETPVLVHLPHVHGHQQLRGEDAHSERHLQVHHGAIPLLPEEHPAMAEQPQAQPLLQRLLHQDPAQAGPPRQRVVLGPAPCVRGHVRERQLPKEAEAIQAQQARERRHRSSPRRPQTLRDGRAARRAGAGQNAADGPGRGPEPPAAHDRDIPPHLLQAALHHREHHRPRPQTAPPPARAPAPHPAIHAVPAPSVLPAVQHGQLAPHLHVGRNDF